VARSKMSLVKSFNITCCIIFPFYFDVAQEHNIVVVVVAKRAIIMGTVEVRFLISE